MVANLKLIRPKTLIRDGTYLWLQRERSGGALSSQPIIFISYYPCPAFVIVRDDRGRKRRCLRDEIFNPESDGKSHTNESPIPATNIVQ